MRRQYHLLAAALIFVPLAAAQQPQIIKGPYLQNMTRDSVVVMWETNVPLEGVVEFGTTTAYGTKATLQPAARIHEVRLSPLRPGTRYHYRVTTGQLVTPDATFRTAPDQPEPFTFIAYGDSRSRPDVHAGIVQNMLRYKPAFVLNTGDLVSNGLEYEQWGPQFFAPLQPLIKSVPIWPCLGNHERNSRYYYQFFSLPGNESWYAFDWGDAHFVALDSNADTGGFAPESEQYKWLEQDLKRTNKLWRFVFFHHPGYTTGRPGSGALIRQYLAPLFERYRVDVVFNGHDHIYERSFPIKAGKRNWSGTTWIVTGGGGAPLYSVSPELFTQHAEAAHHFCAVRVDGRTVEIQVERSDRSSLDHLLLTRDRRPLLALSDQLAAARGDELVRAVERIAALSRADTVPVLAPLAWHRDVRIRRAVARGLGNSGSEATVSALTRMMADTDETVRAEAAWALAKVLPLEQTATLIQLARDPQPRVRYAAIAGLKMRPDRHAVPALAHTLDNAGEALLTRREAAFALGRIEDDAVVAPLTRALRDPSDTVSATAITALVQAKRAGKAVPGLIAALRHPRSATRRAACSALAEAGAQQAVPALIAALADREHRVRNAALAALRKLTGQDLPLDKGKWEQWHKAQ